MLAIFKKHIERNFPDLLSNHFVLACSGGLDSVVLSHLCHTSALGFSMAHCNFQLRGSSSDGDEEFVAQLAADLNKKYFVTRFNTESYIHENKVSVQVAARELRYRWFADIMLENNIKILVTAHHADDNLETFLINLSRGTGIDGLTGIPERKEAISRPLLIFSRGEIETYAKSEGLLWREDGSNQETKYLRNAIRHKVVPLLKELHPTFLDNFMATQERLDQTSKIASQYVQDIRSEIFKEDKGITVIEIKALRELNPIKGYLYGLFKDYGFTEWDNVENLLTAMSGKEIRSKTHRLLKDRDALLLSEIVHEKNESFMIGEGQSAITKPLNLVIHEVSGVDQPTKNVLFVDKETLKYPLTLRKWQKGDYFYPLGMQGKKKLSKFFKDEKIDVLSKERQWLLCSDDKIVWVVGRRADERFKIKAATKKIVKVTWVK